MSRACRALVATSFHAALASGGAWADEPGQQLAERYAPVVRLQAQAEPCGHGEPYQPTDVGVVLDNEEVALRGPWDGAEILAIGPTADDLGRGLFGYHLDFPGDPLDPGCDYEKWSKRITSGSDPTLYARIASDPQHPGELALQYWFFYAFNDFNNKHEGDWEMIQLVFEAPNAAAALEVSPVRVGYSQHEGAEEAKWGAPKLEIVRGTHPVVYVAAGSHASYFEPGLHLGRGAEEGVGCDDTTGPSRSVEPRISFVPTAPDDYLPLHAWLAYEGRWGEKRPAFYNGPTGPNTKPQWARPITWVREKWRARSYAIVGGRSLGPRATDFFCDAVERGSNLLTRLTGDPTPVLLALGALVGLLCWAASRTRWRGSAPLRLERRRAWGQILSVSVHMYAGHALLFAGIGLVFVPLRLLTSALQAGLFQLTGLRSLLDSAGEWHTTLTGLAFGLELSFGLLALLLVQAACARALVEIDAGGSVTVLGAYRRILGRLWDLVSALLWLSLAAGLFALTVFGLPICVWLIGRWSLLAQAAELESHTPRAALARSAELVRGRWWRSATMLLAVAGTAILLGPLVGVGLLLFTGAPFALVNVVSSLVYSIAIPFVAIATTYLFFDLRVRQRLEPRTLEADVVLPAET
jgi:hypothetical protein